MTFSNWLRRFFGKIEYSYADLLMFGVATAIGSHGLVQMLVTASVMFVWGTFIRQHINEGNDND